MTCPRASWLDRITHPPRESMTVSTLTRVFADAAAPQKAVFILLVVALTAALAGIAIGLSRRSPTPSWRRGMAHLRCAGPLLGLLTAGLNGLHMAQTI